MQTAALRLAPKRPPNLAERRSATASAASYTPLGNVWVFGGFGGNGGLGGFVPAVALGHQNYNQPPPPPPAAPPPQDTVGGVETVEFADGITIVSSDSKTSSEMYSMVRKLTERVDTHTRQIQSLTDRDRDRDRARVDSETAHRQTLSTPQPLMFRPIAIPAAQAPSKRQKQV